MSLDNVRKKILRLPDKDFKQLCKKIAAGMGFLMAKVYTAPGLPSLFRETLVRESTDKMFRTEESWMIVFLNSPSRDSLKLFPRLVKAAEGAGDQHLFTAAFFEVDEETREIYHAAARNLEIRSILVSGEFALDLACDYEEDLNQMVQGNRFSFARVRAEMKQMAGKADWRSQFQSLTTLPTRVSPGREEADLDEADLSRAAFKTPSFLLLGEPGAGKTTSLQVLAEVLAFAGGALPVFMPLNRYSGNLLKDLGEILCDDSAPLAEEKTLELLDSGALLVMLDGLNEVRVEAVNQIAEEINRFTDPGSPASHSGWIVSGRKYDYRVAHKPLEHLEKHTWLLQPLTPDLIYSFLAAGLGKTEGKEVYGKLGPAVREICANPLLLNMVLTVRRETGQLPDGRGALYHCFIDLLFRWGDKTAKQELLEEMSKHMGFPVTGDEYIRIANSALMDVAEVMGTTAVPWGEARDIVMGKSLTHAKNGAMAAKTLLDDLMKRGILKSQQYRVSFFHHTFQEYFQALRMKDLPIETLIPEGGVAGAYREAVVFLAGLIGNAGRLTERALTYDYLLAYEMVRDAGPLINQEIKLKVAKKLWGEITAWEGWTGERRQLALKFIGLAGRMGRTVEQLARDILKPPDEIEFSDELLRFYQEIGDLAAQKKLIEGLGMDKKNQEEIPGGLLFSLAISARHSGDYKRAVDLYTKYLEKYPNVSMAYHNRAIAYQNMGKKQEALADYNKALELDPKHSVYRTNLAQLLKDMGEKEKALAELKTAIKDDPNYAAAHFELANMLESSCPEEALTHFEKAARLSIDTKYYQNILEKLAGVQETLGRYGGAVRSLKQLIEMDPTSSEVKEWKQRIARVRLEMDKQEKSRTLRERLQEGGDLPLPVFAREFLAAVGLETRQASSLWVFTDTKGSALPTPLPFVLLDVHALTGADLRETIASAPKQVKGAGHMILLTTADVIENDAMMQLSAYQAEKKIALVTFAEAQEAFLQGDRYCYQLVNRALRRADTAHDPFDYTEVIRERSEFFGRSREIKAIKSALQNHQTMGLYGIHKIGKSSLLKQVSYHLNAFSRDITTIWVEMEPGVKTISDLYHLILEQLPGEDPGIPDDAFITTRQFRVKLAHFQRQKQRERPNHHLLLILDEYPYLIPGSTGFPGSSSKGQARGVKDYIEALSTFKTLSQEGWFTLLPCGRSAALSRAVRWDEGENPFIGILKEKFLGPITREETFTLLKALGNRTGIRFDDKALESIYALSGGHPFFTRKLGSWLLHFKKGNRIEEAMVEQAAKAYLDNRGDRALLLGIYEEKLDDEERRIARLLARADKPLPPKDLMPGNADDKTYRRVRDAAANLIDTTVIKEDENKKLSHNYELLRRVIEEDTREQEKWTS